MPPVDDGRAPEDDPLERTDRLPMMAGMAVDSDVEDDAVPMEAPPVSTRSVFARPAAVFEIPTPTETRSEPVRPERRVHGDRGLRTSTDYLALKRAHSELRDIEAASTARAAALGNDLAVARAELEAERARTSDLDRALTDRALLVEATRAVLDDTRREIEHQTAELQVVRDALAARDASLAETLHRLAERDAELGQLRREHAELVPKLEERSQAAVELEAALQASQAQVTSLTAELGQLRREHAELVPKWEERSQAALRLETALQASQAQAKGLTADLAASEQSAAALAKRLKAADAEVRSVSRDLESAKAQTETYLEQLRTREWRRGFDENTLRDFDEKLLALQAERNALRTERDQYAAKVQDQDQAAAEAAGRLAALDAERTRLASEVAARDAALASEVAARDAALLAKDAALQAAVEAALAKAQAQAEAAAEQQAKREADALAAVEQERQSLAAQVERMKLDLQRRGEEMEVLLTHLNEARRPIEPLEAQLKRLTEELALKTRTLEQAADENRALHLALERARGVLDEREFLIRRLERNDTSLPASQLPPQRAPGPEPASISAELVRVDGNHGGVFQLLRRTRIGRAPGCELHVESSSVSRHHALVMMTAREVIIEDLHSTNGVLVNGRKITRQLLNDGDRLTIGEAQFRVRIKPVVRPAATAQSASAGSGPAAGPDAAGPPGGAAGPQAASDVGGSSARAGGVAAAQGEAPPKGEPSAPAAPASGLDVPGGQS